MIRIIRSIHVALVICVAAGCASNSSYSPYDHVTPYRSPDDMERAFADAPCPVPPRVTVPILTGRTTGETPEIPRRRPLPAPTTETPDTQTPTRAPAEILKNSRVDATQHPSEKRFINAVQVYEFVPGAIYEVFAAPGYVTMLYLRPGEELKHLAAGDTSRWLIDVVDAGDADAPNNGRSPGDHPSAIGRVAVLIKPRFADLATNVVITTNERTYLIDLRSQNETYHTAVEWAFPKSPTVFPAGPQSRKPEPPVRDTGIRNYLYTLKAPPRGLPPWAPQAVYDDGHRVYVQFDPSIDDHERPPLYLLDADGMARMVNYRTESNYYVIDQLFDRAALRIGSERVVIERVRPRPNVFTDVPRINYTRKQ